MSYKIPQVTTGKVTPVYQVGDSPRQSPAIAIHGGITSAQLILNQDHVVVLEDGSSVTLPQGMVAYDAQNSTQNAMLLANNYVTYIPTSNLHQLLMTKESQVDSIAAGEDIYTLHLISDHKIRRHQPRPIAVPTNMTTIPADVSTEGHYELRTHEWGGRTEPSPPEDTPIVQDQASFYTDLYGTGVFPPGPPGAALEYLGWLYYGDFIFDGGTASAPTLLPIGAGPGGGWPYPGADCSGWAEQVQTTRVHMPSTLLGLVTLAPYYGQGDGSPPAPNMYAPPRKQLWLYVEILAPEGLFDSVQLLFYGWPCLDGFLINGTLIPGTSILNQGSGLIVDLDQSLLHFGGFNSLCCQVHNDDRTDNVFGYYWAMYFNRTTG